MQNNDTFSISDRKFRFESLCEEVKENITPKRKSMVFIFLASFNMFSLLDFKRENWSTGIL